MTFQIMSVRRTFLNPGVLRQCLKLFTLVMVFALVGLSTAARCGAITRTANGRYLAKSSRMKDTPQSSSDSTQEEQTFVQGEVVLPVAPITSFGAPRLLVPSGYGFTVGPHALRSPPRC